ncbi:MAG: M13 family metallopeptidase [Paludibacteraceae bacterium]|nr:M13 family metallopeptidase [Paludibacteraceae bacterium]
MNTKHLLLIATSIMAISCSHKAQQTTGIDPTNLDTTIVAQNDFYHYACGGWMVKNPLTAEYSRFGSFDVVREANRKQLNELIGDIAKGSYEQGTIEQKIADLYNMAMDTVRRDSEGIAPIQPALDELWAITDRAAFARYLGASLQCGIWGMYVDADEMNSSMNILKAYQGGFALGEKEYYIDEDEETLRIRNAYVKHVANMFRLCGYDQAEERAATVLRLETRLAKAAKNNVELRDPQANYNKMSIAELKTLCPEVNWDEYLEAAGIHTDSLSVGQPEHLKEAGKMLNEEPLTDLQNYFTWQIIDGGSPYLTTDLFNENFDFYGKILSGKEEPSPLWKRAVGIVDGTLGEAVGQMYVSKYFPAENKERMLELVHNLQTSLGQRIDAQEWMSAETKVQAHEKLASFVVKIGYPDKWRSYDALEINKEDAYFTNLLRASRFEIDYSLSHLDKPVDKAQWYMTPQTVNAYYNPSSNEICFPAGILQYPFFDMDADDAFNYGAIGVVIGHEMTHGFDDQGAQFDKEGNLKMWWTEEDFARFQERTKVMEEYFNQIEVAPGVHANGAFTLGENIADHGGLMISYQAFQNAQAATTAKLSEADGFTPAQRFFLAYANLWAQNIRPEAVLLQTKSDPHSLGEWRVNGALPHIDAWYEAFNVDETSPMYVAPEKRVSIW